MSQQLFKKGANGKYSNVNPKSWTEAIKDKNTGQNLVEILQGFNMYFLSYTGDKESTRCLVPNLLRKKGLWITYVDYDGLVYTEWYAANSIKDDSWENSSNWRDGSNMLVGDISISSNGNWVINGVETNHKATGERGYTPILRVGDNNKLQASYDGGYTFSDISQNSVFTQFAIIGNKLNISDDLGKTWKPISEYIASWFRVKDNKLEISRDNTTWSPISEPIASWFRWEATEADSQANNLGRLQISRDNRTWDTLSGDIIKNLHISKYIGADDILPTTGISEGTIYAKGPTYAEDDTLNENPIYRLWVYAWKNDVLAWVDNGEFTSIAAGIVQETGNSETELMSQKAITEEIGSRISVNQVDYKSLVNMYDASKQTASTISPHYYFEGVPYEDTKYDNIYNATDFFEVTPKTLYSIALIPAFGEAVLPWFNSEQGIFFYDKDKKYISKTSEATFTTPSRARYARFNYDISVGITLKRLNERCVMVVGDSIPTSYIPYNESVFGINMNETIKDIDSINTFVKGADNELYGESLNLYDASLQTADTIDPRYYFNGKPYTSTEYDNSYNATALFELKPNTEYSLGLVPEYGILAKPWGDTSEGIFFYDENGTYISKASSITFVTPEKTKYARFNYNISLGLSLKRLNERCMIVYGNQLPTEYSSYFKVSLKSRIENLEERTTVVEKATEGLVYQSINLYDNSIQTPDTISPHYYYNGYPYSTDQFDSKYYATAMFGIEANTQYSLGLVPKYGTLVKPWGDTEQGIFFYDSDGNYISKTSSSSFVTPPKSAFARFNVSIDYGITLNRLNSMCMLVKGDSLPTEYTPFYNYTIKEKVEDIEHNIGNLSSSTSKNTYFRVKEDEIELYQKGGNNTDYAIILKRKGGNELFDFYRFLKYNNTNTNIETDINKYTLLTATGTDWHAPFKLKADNNGDGDNKNSDGEFNDYFTGGNHQYNNGGSGSVSTAQSIALKFYVDGREVVNGDEGYANIVIMKWSNQIQGQNTTKLDGSGRYILQENHELLFDGYSFKSYVELIPLEDIHISTWYGFQAVYSNLFNELRYIDSSNRMKVSLPSSSVCNSFKECRGMKLTGDILSLEMSVDNTFDLGKRDYNNNGYAAFSETYGKVYFGIISSSECGMKSGEMYALRGEYRFVID